MGTDSSGEDDRTELSDSEIILNCERVLSEILENNRNVTAESCEMDLTCEDRPRLEKRKEREEEDDEEDDFITVVRRKPKRFIRSESVVQREKDGENNEVCITCLKELPKQMAMAKLLRNEKIQNIIKIKYKSPYKVFISFENNEDAEKLMTCQKFKEMEFRCHKTFDTSISYGIVRGVDLDISEEEMLEVLKSDCNILSVKRLKRINSEGKWVDSETVTVCFQNDTLPQYVRAYECRFEVEKYIFPVTQCFGCWKFGHTIKFCPVKKILCPKCGSVNHANCDKEFKCLNCKGLHFVLDKCCPMYLKEKEIRCIMSNKNMSYKSALQAVFNSKQMQHVENPINSNNERIPIQTFAPTRKTYSSAVVNREVHRAQIHHEEKMDSNMEDEAEDEIRKVQSKKSKKKKKKQGNATDKADEDSEMEYKTEDEEGYSSTDNEERKQRRLSFKKLWQKIRFISMTRKTIESKIVDIIGVIFKEVTAFISYWISGQKILDILLSFVKDG